MAFLSYGLLDEYINEAPFNTQIDQTEEDEVQQDLNCVLSQSDFIRQAIKSENFDFIKTICSSEQEFKNISIDHFKDALETGNYDIIKLLCDVFPKWIGAVELKNMKNPSDFIRQAIKSENLDFLKTICEESKQLMDYLVVDHFRDAIDTKNCDILRILYKYCKQFNREVLKWLHFDMFMHSNDIKVVACAIEEMGITFRKSRNPTQSPKNLSNSQCYFAEALYRNNYVLALYLLRQGCDVMIKDFEYLCNLVDQIIRTNSWRTYNDFNQMEDLLVAIKNTRNALVDEFDWDEYSFC